MESPCPRLILELQHYGALVTKALLCCSHYPLWCTQLTLKAPSPSLTSSTLTGSIKASFSFLFQSRLTGCCCRLICALKLRVPIKGWRPPKLRAPVRGWRSPGPSSHAQHRRPGSKKPAPCAHPAFKVFSDILENICKHFQIHFLVHQVVYSEHNTFNGGCFLSQSFWQGSTLPPQEEHLINFYEADTESRRDTLPHHLTPGVIWDSLPHQE